MRSHKPSVYHLMDRLGYDVFKVESASAVCPPAICPGTRTRRPGVLARLAGSGRPGRWNAWLATIRRRERPGFYLHHSLLPHEPWIYLPSGRRSRPTGEDPIPGINKPPSFDDRDLSQNNHLRHLLQVGYVDRQIGMLLRRLRRTRQLEDALLFVLADHGYSFDMNVPSRRLVTEDSIDEVAPVPFFIKRPGQTAGEGEVDESFVRNIDVVPTIADVLGTDVHWRHDGHSAFSAATRARRQVALVTRDFSQVVRIGRDELDRRRLANRRRWATCSGPGLRACCCSATRGRRPTGSGRIQSCSTGAWPASTASRSRASRPRSETATSYAPCPQRRARSHPRGRPPIGCSPGRERDLAVAVNGRIRAIGRSFHLWRRECEYFSMIVPESALRDGANRVELFEVRRGHAGAARRRARPGSAHLVGGVRLRAPSRLTPGGLTPVDEGAEVALRSSRAMQVRK